MLQRLELRNFQCHERLSLELSPQVTLLLGPSDSGKSAVIRALRWLVFDRPQGTGFISNGKESCQVRLTIDGQRLVRRRKAGANEYQLDGQTFRAWGGNGPPEPIRQILDLGPENFQGQHDPSYWLNLPAGAVATALNEIVDLGLIDSVTQAVAGRLRSAKAEETVSANRLQQAEEQFKQLEEVPQLQEEFEGLNQLRTAAFTITGRAAAISRAVETGRGMAAQVEELRQAATDGAMLVRLVAKARSLGLQQTALQETREELQEAQRMAEEPLPNLDGLEEVYQRSITITDALVRIRNWRNDYVVAKKSLVQAERELGEALAESREKTKGICPICGGVLRIGEK